MSKTNAQRPFQIDPWQQIAFDAITSNSDSIGLIPCRVGGEDSACIVTGRPTARGMEFMPLFVAMTPGLEVAFPASREGEEGGGGGPRRTPDAPARAFAVNKVSVTHG